MLPLLVLLGSALPGRAQANYWMADTARLQTRLRQPNLPDTVRVDVLGRLGMTLTNVNGPAGLRIMHQALALAQRVGYRRRLPLLYVSLGSMEQHVGHYPAAGRWFEQSMRVAQQLHDTVGTADVLEGMGVLATFTGDFDQALRYFQQDDALLAHLRVVPGRAAKRLNVQINIAGLYGNLKNYPALVRLSRQCLMAAAALDTPTDQRQLILANMGEGLLQLGKLDSAALVLNQSRALAVAAHNDDDLGAVLANLAKLALRRQQPAAAEGLARQALVLARRVGEQEDEAEALQQLAAAQYALHRPAAYATLDAYLALHDTLVNHDQTRAIATAHARFNDAGQQAEIRALRQTQRLAAQSQELTHLRTQRERAGLGALALLVLAGAGAAAWQYRRRQAARLAADATALRQRLAADLHDDVGNLLTQLNLQSGLLSEPHAYSPAQVAARLETLATTARRAAQQMSDVVWGLGAAQRTLPELLAHMRDHAQEVLTPAGVDVAFTTTLDATCPAPPAEAQQQLYLIFKEALHNVVKHARATLVHVSLHQTPAGLVLTVADDGRGHDGAARPNGQGLGNMQARAVAVGGRAAYRALAPGFEVQVELLG